MSQQECNLEEQKAAQGSYLYLHSTVQAACAASQRQEQKWWSVFELQVQSLALQKAEVFREKGTEAFTYLCRTDSHCQGHTDLAHWESRQTLGVKQNFHGILHRTIP